MASVHYRTGLRLRFSFVFPALSQNLKTRNEFTLRDRRQILDSHGRRFQIELRGGETRKEMARPGGGAFFAGRWPVQANR